MLYERSERFIIPLILFVWFCCSIRRDILRGFKVSVEKNEVGIFYRILEENLCNYADPLRW